MVRLGSGERLPDLYLATPADRTNERTVLLSRNRRAILVSWRSAPDLQLRAPDEFIPDLTTLDLPPEVTTVVEEFRLDRSDGQVVLNFHQGRIASMKITRHKRINLTGPRKMEQNQSR